MSDIQFVDADARHQLAIQLNSHLFVDAGAGTGKTTALVGRIVNLIVAGNSTIDSIAAITFTEAAAGELRERLRTALEVRRAASKNEEASRCAAALADLESASIQTIHGFAQRIISRFPVEAGVPPTFEVQDRIESKLRSDERWDLFLYRTLVATNGLEANDQAVIRTAVALGLTQGHLKELATALRPKWFALDSLLTEPTGQFQPVPVQTLLSRAEEVVAGFDHCNSDEDRLVEWCQESLDPWLRQLRVAASDPDPLAVIELLERSPSTRVGNRGRQADWAADQLKAQKDRIQAFGELVNEMLDAPRQWALQGVVRMVAGFVVTEAAERVKKGTLEFDDLLVHAVMVAENPKTQIQLRQSWRHVFVDEFQDTDPLQVRLVSALIKPADELVGEGAFIFTVGDPKQSIYRFRGADLDQFQAVKAERSGEIVNLTTNFRTVDSVIGWLNDVFEPMLASSVGDWSSLDASRSGGGGVVTIGDALEGLRARDVREIEAAEIVGQLVKAKEERWAVESRSINYGDMAVLMPTRRSLPALERELRRAQVPYRVESRSLIWATQEVRDVTAVLKAISDPRSEVAVFAALRSAAFACGDDELYQWRKSGNGWDYRMELADELRGTRVGKALNRLNVIHQRHFWIPVSQFVAEVVGELRMYELAFARPRQREAWNRLRFVIDRARAWTEDGGSGLHSFVQWIETQDREAADAIETVVPEADDDAVRVLTIHAAKGLEFPLTAVVGLGSKDTITNSARVLWNKAGHAEFRLGSQARGWETPGFSSIDTLEKAKDEDEQRRLLYVAATRARDYLVISLFRQASKRGSQSLAAQLAEVMPESEYESPAEAGAQMQPLTPAKVVRLDLSAAERAEQRRAILKHARRTSSLSATAIASKAVGAESVLPSSAAGSNDFDANDLAERLAFGSAVHSALEAIPFDANENQVRDLATELAEQYGLAHRTADIERSVHNALASHHVRRAISSGRWWREVPVYGSAGEMVIGGTIDLLYEIDGELVVVDYKTENVKDDEATQAALERYKWQLVTYVDMCQKTTGKNVREAALLFIPPAADGATAVAIKPLDELIQRLESEVLPTL